MFFLYILKSAKNGRWYIGMSEDVRARLIEHNAGRVRSTKGYRPWHIIYTEPYQTKTEARKREIQVKKSGLIRKMLKEQLNMAPSSNGYPAEPDPAPPGDTGFSSV